MMFSAGLVTGWWLHNKMPANQTAPLVIYPENAWSPPPGFLQLPQPREHAAISADLLEFEQMLDEQRYDDALVIFQRHERLDSELSYKLRRMLLNTLDQWAAQGESERVVEALERFGEYYYQDLELQKRLAKTLEEQQELARAIEVQLTSRSFASRAEDVNTLDDSIHRLSRELFKQKQKALQLDETLGLYQKLSMLEPDYGFYRFALAESYLALDDLMSAIRELEILQIDPEFGRKAANMLAALLPPAPEEIEEQPVGLVPLIGTGRHYMVDVTAGRRSSARLLIDTGASLTTLPPETLSELRRQKQAVRVGHVDLKTANGLLFSPLYRLKELHIGNFILKNLEVAELDLMGTGQADGLLGMNALGQFHFQINQDRNTLTLQPRH
ncbi:MAG: aspartyl protease family protein [Endozoicomonas sp.]